ncbi:MAG: CDP-glucose 4,6-dehydratase [Bdellovibrio sp.]
MDHMDLRSFYKGKKVLVTGHTGFKGSWLSWVLLELGAKVVGYSKPPVDYRGNHFNLTRLAEEMSSYEGNTLDVENFTNVVKKEKPEIILHLAAQPIVNVSYEDPVETFQSNAMGTIHLLEILRNTDFVRAGIFITSDKCYENREWLWPYRETETLGGHDPYSASKAMAEIAISAYYRSYFQKRGVAIASARAGNVIGGGDFAKDRIIPDIVQALDENRSVVLRSPMAVRPWQHVLDVNRGYLSLAMHAYQQPAKYSTPYNLAPQGVLNKHNVLYVTKKFVEVLGRGHYEIDPSSAKFHEATLLRLDPSKAMEDLKWTPSFSTDETISFTASWYAEFLKSKENLRAVTLRQIQHYLSLNTEL